MSKKTSTLLAQVSAVPKDEPFVQITFELMNSPSWRAKSISCSKLLDFLMLEHMAHKGMENGNLLATYNQLEQFGIARNCINKTIQEAENLGLVIAERKGRQARNKNYCTCFKLTFLPHSFHNEKGVKMYSEPSNDWRMITDAEIEKLKNKKVKRLNFNSDCRNLHSTGVKSTTNKV